MESAEQINVASRKYAFWHKIHNAHAVLALHNLINLENFPTEWRLEPYDACLERMLTYDEQLSAVVAIVGETTWDELVWLKDSGFVSIAEFFERLCEAITHPSRPCAYTASLPARQALTFSYAGGNRAR